MNETERLRALLAGGTPGPWRASGSTVWKPANPDDPTDWTGFAIAHAPESDEGAADAAKIAAAVLALPALLDVAEAARAVAKFAPNTFETEAEAGFVFQGLLSILRAALDRLEGAS